MKTRVITLLVLSGILFSTTAFSTVVTSGRFDLTLNKSALAPLQIIRWFDVSRSQSKTEEEMRKGGTSPNDFDGSVDPDITTNETFTFDVFDGSSNATDSLQGRKPKITDFEFTDSSDPGGTSVKDTEIGLGGVIVLTSNLGESATTLGDFSLRYSENKWLLSNHVSFSVVDAFRLTNVETKAIDQDNFSLKGNIEYNSSAIASFYGGAVGESIGTFKLTTTTLKQAGEPVIEPGISGLDQKKQASFIVDNGLLSLPVVQVQDDFFSAKLRLVDLGGLGLAFDLENSSATTENSSTQAEFLVGLGLLKMPEVVVVEDNVITGKFRVEAKIDEEFTDTIRFVLVSAEKIKGIATYSVDDGILTVPVLKQSNQTYRATYKLIDLGDGAFGLEQSTFNLTSQISDNPAEFFESSSTIKIPKIEIISKGMVIGLIKSEMILEEHKGQPIYILTLTENL